MYYIIYYYIKGILNADHRSYISRVFVYLLSYL